MSSWKTCSVIIVINLALLWIASFTVELYSLVNKVESVNETLPTAIESALNTALQSEEMFGNGSANFDSKTGRQQNIVYYNGSEWVNANIYSLARAAYPGKFDFDKQADSQLVSGNNANVIGNADINKDDSERDFCELYAWTFADETGVAERTEGTDYLDEKGVSKYIIQNTPNDYLDNFYSQIGKEYKTRGFVTKYDSTGFVTSQDWKSYDTLEQTGFDLNPDVDKSIVNANYVTQDSEYIAKRGKTKVYKYNSSIGGNDVSSAKSSTYMLTPYSLGLTYLDPRVTKTVIAANIIKTMQLQALNISSEGDNALQKSVGNIQVGKSDIQTVDTTSSTVNNGQFEVDVNLDNIKVNIEYANVNFFDKDNCSLINKVQGYTPGTDADSNNTKTVEKLVKSNTAKLYNYENGRVSEDTQTSKTDPERGNRVVAKVTVKLDLNIPYTTPLMRYVRGKLFADGSTSLGTKGENHFGILRLAGSDSSSEVTNSDVANNGVHINPTKLESKNRSYGDYDYNTDSLQYQYTTYVAITD